MLDPLVHTQIKTKKCNLLLIFRHTVHIKHFETDRISQREALH